MEKTFEIIEVVNDGGGIIKFKDGTEIHFTQLADATNAVKLLDIFREQNSIDDEKILPKTKTICLSDFLDYEVFAETFKKMNLTVAKTDSSDAMAIGVLPIRPFCIRYQMGSMLENFENSYNYHGDAKIEINSLKYFAQDFFNSLKNTVKARERRNKKAAE